MKKAQNIAARRFAQPGVNEQATILR